MKVMTKDVKINGRSECFYLVGIFDPHLGVRACDEIRLKEEIEWIRTTPNAYAFLGGDMCDFINPSDKRFDSDTLTDKSIKGLSDLARIQGDQMVDLLMPIKDKLWFGLEGNHEQKIKARYNNDVGNYICMRLGIPYLGYVAGIKIRVSRCSPKKGKSKSQICINLFACHGFGGAQTFGGKIKRLSDIMKWFEADIYWMGHVHALGSVIEPRFYMTKILDWIHACDKIFILGGTYLKTYINGESGYGERKGYAPVPIGSVRLKITPFPGTTKTAFGKELDRPPLYECSTVGSGSVAELFNEEIPERGGLNVKG